MTNKPHSEVTQAVALGYQQGHPAPRVLGQGRQELAQAIVAKAAELDIPIKVEPDLVAFLMELKPNSWVPPELYTAVAQILAWAYELDGRAEELRQRENS